MIGVTFGLALLAPAQDPDRAGIEFFEKRIRPVLVERCYTCHSAQAAKVKGGLLLDSREGSLKGGNQGRALVPGDPERSLLVKALRWADPDLQMPPKEKLPDEQIADFEAWVRRGAPDPRTGASSAGMKAALELAEARKFWSFQPPKAHPAPAVKDPSWGRTFIDPFILARLEEKGFRPAPPADPRTLLRRATYGLTGLPPSPEELEAFLADGSPDAFAKAVDRLLASPRYGERWGRHWLDVARYADTKGDVDREERRYPYAWTYRDWVIRALNDDMPYDRFLACQIAADRLDRNDLAALGFLTVGRRFNNNAHDIIDDRIDVVMRGLQGLTITCARCHDHKYDPLPTKDYYSLYGVFASSTEPKVYPLLPQKERTEANLAFEKELAVRQGEVDKALAEIHARIAGELRAVPHITAQLLALHEARGVEDKDLRPIAQKHLVKEYVLRRWRAWGSKAGAPIFSAWSALSALPDKEFAAKAPEVAAAIADPLLRERLAEPPASIREAAGRFALALAGHEAFKGPEAPPSFPLSDVEQVWGPKDRDRLVQLRKKVSELEGTHPGAPARAMVLEDAAKPVEPRVFIRGNAGNRGDAVPRQFPAIASPEKREPFKDGSGRLELARAISSKENPLTARVLVNRVWMQHFGQGIVRTPSDFGTRGDPPTHPELLDTLAVRFVEEGRSLKKLHRWILLSAAYRQSSEDNPAARAADPANTLLWRMNRERLDLEALRDSILAVSGQLDASVGGRAVDLSAPPYTRRRTVYAFIDRQNLPGMFRTFDFASPDVSNPQRFITTVPQQALFLMNHPFVAEQARLLVGRPDILPEKEPAARVQRLFGRVYGRAASPEEEARALRFLGSETADPVAKAATGWQYGFGEYDSGAGRLKGFQAMGRFTGSAWTADDRSPSMAITATGGRPGKDATQAVVRRWVAPRDGTASIGGALAHLEREGDGVVARIVTSRSGEIASWTLRHLSADVKIEGFEVRRGDTIDFVVEPRGTPDGDAFTWSPVVRLDQEAWDAAKDFGGPPSKGPAPVSAWEQYAQALLLSNEFAFLD